VPTKITRPLATGAVGVAEGEVRGLRAEDVLTDFSRSVVSTRPPCSAPSLRLSDVLLPQLRQYLTGLSDPKLLRISR
jgi:hypothetical protein